MTYRLADAPVEDIVGKGIFGVVGGASQMHPSEAIVIVPGVGDLGALVIAPNNPRHADAIPFVIVGVVVLPVGDQAVIQIGLIARDGAVPVVVIGVDRKSTRLNSSH